MLTLLEERSFVVLGAVLAAGGSPKRATALTDVVERGYLELTRRDREPNLSRNEARWRTDLSWVRNYLVMRGYLSGSTRGHWTITEEGQQYCRELAEAVATTITFRLLSATAVALAYELA